MAEESFTPLERLVSTGKELGYVGDELKKFVEEQQKLERDSRAERRRLESEQLEAARRKVEADTEKLRLQLELERLRAEGGEERSGSSVSSGHEGPLGRPAPIPQLPRFSEDRDSIDAYIARFEMFAEDCDWPVDRWATSLAALLTGKALDIVTTLPRGHQKDFDKVKEALLKGYDLTEEGFRRRFRSAKIAPGETYAQFGVRLDHYFDKWVELSGSREDFDGVKALIIKEQIISGCSPDLVTHLRMQRPTTTEALLEAAEVYREARVDVKASQPGLGHKDRVKDRDLPRRGTPGSNLQPSGPPQRPQNFQPQRERPPERRECFLCRKTGHIARDCRSRPQKVGAMHVVPANEEVVERGVEKAEASAGMNAETMIVSGVCGFRGEEPMPVHDGLIGKEVVSVLRDTGCSGAVVRESLVSDKQFTGETRLCTLIDGTVREFKTARVAVSTPFFTGDLEALVMPNPMYDLIVGNVEGARQPNDPDPSFSAAAVETRSQAKKEAKGPKPLVTPEERSSIGATPKEIREAQRADPSLTKLFQAAENGETTEVRGGTGVFQVENGLLYRIFTSDKTKRSTSQLVVPASFREVVMSVGHESLFSGHLGQGKTADRVMSNFYWPGAGADIKRFCASCDTCQRTAPRGRTKKAPLGSVPLIDTPFRRVAVDIVGPISPASSSGNRYILTLVDYATRYPEAVALRGIQTERVAEALVEMFSRVGVPNEILSDRGSQFTSDLFKEVSRLLGMRQLHTTPYHPQCNGLVEKFNGTLKSMLRKMCEERPQDWDRYLPAVLFAYREAPQDSLGFSPFELLYGRTVRGPVSILREMWTSEEEGEEVKTTYQYVLDLRERLEETCQFAQDALQKAGEVYKRQYNKKASARELQVGDKVLLLLPTDHNKILMHWKGPFVVLEKKGAHDYKLDVHGQPKTFHVNMLRKYNERAALPDPQVKGGTAVIDTQEQDPSSEGEIMLFDCDDQETHRDVLISEDLTESEIQEVRRICEEYRDVLTDRPGCCTLESCHIDLTTKQPVQVRQYPIPYSTNQIIAEEVEKMQELGVIEPSNSPYSAPVVIVKKKSGEHRFCIDYRRLNNVTKVDAEVMPNIEDLYAQLSSGRNKYVTKIDLSKGYWQVALDEESKPLTAFSTPSGHFQFRMMPFGLVNAPAVFTRMMRRLLHGLKGVVNFMDDILITSSEWEEHMSCLQEIFKRLRQAHLTARPTKCQIGYPNLDFLGFVIGEDTKQPEKTKVEKMLSTSRPSTKKEIRSLLGLIGFYREFVPNFAALTSPLSDMVKKGQPERVEWTEAAERALEAVKQRLGSYPILKLPDFTKPFILRTDASGAGLGAVLLQEHDGQKFPVRYASRKLNRCEMAYATVEKECLAVVWGVQKFQKYLYGTNFILETDHQPLQFLQKAQLKNSRVLRWAMTLQPYRFRISYIPGRENVGADYLSRVV